MAKAGKAPAAAKPKASKAGGSTPKKAGALKARASPPKAKQPLAAVKGVEAALLAAAAEAAELRQAAETAPTHAPAAAAAAKKQARALRQLATAPLGQITFGRGAGALLQSYMLAGTCRGAPGDN